MSWVALLGSLLGRMADPVTAGLAALLVFSSPTRALLVNVAAAAGIGLLLSIVLRFAFLAFDPVAANKLPLWVPITTILWALIFMGIRALVRRRRMRT